MEFEFHCNNCGYTDIRNTESTPIEIDLCDDCQSYRDRYEANDL